MSRKKWVVSKFDKELCAEISEEYCVPPFAALLAVSRGLTEDEDLSEFFSEEMIYLSDPFELPDMEKAVERIEKAIDENEKICVFGDYDADGVTSTALLYTYLKNRNADVIYYIPDRNLEGYGMNISAIDKIKEQNVNLIISVDNGISAFEEAKRIKELSMELVVTDHHRASEELPEAVAVVDPFRLDCQLESFHEWAGVGVVFKLLEALQNDETENLLEKYSDLVTIGTVGDVVNLRSENRQFVKSGVEKINSSTRLGIEMLKEVSGIADKEVNALSVAFSLCPRINAAGRMGSALTALKLLLSEDEDEARSLAEEINTANSNRQQTEMKILAEAVEQIENNDYLKYSRVIVVDGDGWHSGVIGIVAARLVEKYGKPCLVVSKQQEKVAKGSGRSIPGFSLFDALKACESELVQFGGHTLAAGFGVKCEKIDDFRRAVNDYAKAFDGLFPTLEIDCKINPKFINLELLDAIKKLEPFGAGNKQPLFGLYNMYIEKIEGVSNAKHCKLYLSRNNTYLNVMRFGISPNMLDFKAGDTVDIAVTLDQNVFMGNVKVSVIAKDIKFSSLDDDKVISENKLYEKIKRGEKLDSVSAVKALPSRDLIGRVYRQIKKYGVWQWSAETLDYRIGDDGEKLCAVMVAVDVLEELELVETDRDDNLIKLINPDKKTDLEKSSVLANLKNMI